MTFRKQIGTATLVLGLVAAMLAPPAVQSQTQTGTLSASLLRRLAEAADGYRTGAPIWIVASYAFPHHVAGVFRDSSRAVAVADRLRGQGPYSVFGRFVTAQDLEQDPVLITVPHWPPTIRDSLRSLEDRLPAPHWLFEDVDRLEIVFYPRDTSQEPRHVTMGDVPDALFFTLSAIDKFAIPYYTRLEGPSNVAQWRDSLARYVRSPTR